MLKIPNKISQLKIVQSLGLWLMVGGIFMTTSIDLSGETRKQIYLDSLFQEIEQASDKEKVLLYITLLEPINNPLPNREKISKDAMALAQKLGHKELYGFANLHSSLRLINQGFHSEAKKRLNIAYDYYASLPTNKLLVTTLILQGYNEHRQLFMTDALKVYLKALPLALSLIHI